MTKRLRRQQPQKKVNKANGFRLLKEEIDSSRGKCEKKSLRKPCMRSRSFAPRTLALYEAELERQGIDSDEAVEEEDFFDIAIGSSIYSKCLITPIRVSKPKKFSSQSSGLRHAPKIKKRQVSPQYSSVPGGGRGWSVSSRRRSEHATDTADGADASTPKKYRSWDKDGDDIPDFIEDLYDNSDRHAVGLGCMEKFFGGGEESLRDIKRDRRPYFTYWVTIIQLIIFIVMMATYGIAPIGVNTKTITGEVLMPDLTTLFASYEEKENFWIGPRQDSLIHLGAKYSPCMRVDSNIEAVLEIDRNVENDTGCCVYSDGSGCVQSRSEDCNPVLSTFYKWSETEPGYRNRTSGAVCGQDPRYCLDTEPMLATDWPDDITQWPVCVETDNVTTLSVETRHMTCDVVGRPCCVGIQGECIITTREYCQFRNGYFHDEATLCSQISCIGEICGMITFADEKKPDQFYRFFTSLFLHSGVITMIITLLFQLLFMRDLEKMIGWIPMFFIYLGGGMVGGLASVTFIPYYVETGPSGAQLAVLGALFVEVMRWNNDDPKDRCGPAIGKIIGLVLVLFLVGLVLVDMNNWSNFFGMFYGVCIALTFRPLEEMRGKAMSKACTVSTRVVCIILAVTVLVVLVVIFYVAPITECDNCLYFNCIPFTPTYCDNMQVSIQRNATEIM